MTETSRRALLRAGAMGAVLATVVSGRTAFAATTATRLYARSRFTPMLHAPFRLVGTTGSWPVVLTEVSDLPQAGEGDNRRFGLTFRSSVAGPPQGTYSLRRTRFASTTLFVVPSDANCRTYQAVINRA